MKFSIKAIMLITAEVALLCALPIGFVFALTVAIAAAASILPLLNYRKTAGNPSTRPADGPVETDSVFTLPLLLTVIAFVVLYFRLRG